MYHYIPTLGADTVYLVLNFWFRFLVKEQRIHSGHWVLGRRRESFCCCSSRHQVEETRAQLFCSWISFSELPHIIGKGTTYPCAFGSPEKTKGLWGRGSCCWVSLIMLLYHQRPFRWFCSPSSKASSCRWGVNISISPASSNRILVLPADRTCVKTPSIPMPGQFHITATELLSAIVRVYTPRLAHLIACRWFTRRVRV